MPVASFPAADATSDAWFLVRLDVARLQCAPGSGDELLDAQFRTTGASVERSRHAADMLFQLPVISRAAQGWRFSFADFGLDRALIEPLELKLTIHRPFVSGLPVGEFVVAGETARAFRFQTSWRLLGPWAQRSPLRTSAAR